MTFPIKGALAVLTLGLLGALAVVVSPGLIGPLSTHEAASGAANGAGTGHPPNAAQAAAALPAVSVVKVGSADFVETVLITGSVVPRDEILIAPEIEGYRILELAADEGDRVAKDQVLARLSTTALDAQLAQNEATIARTQAAIAVARSTIVQAEASATEAANAFGRAKPLKQSGYVSEATYDQREQAAKTAEAKLIAARDSLTSAEADRAAAEAARTELVWKRTRTEIRSPVAGVVSRRTARIGAVASAANEPLFRIIARGESELDAEIAEGDIHKIKPGQSATVTITGQGDVAGTVRLISSEVDRSTRLGKVKIFLGANPALRLGAFGRGTIESGRSRGLSVPPSAIVYAPDGATVQVVADNRVQTVRVTVGLKTQAAVEIVDGLSEGATIVARSGSFLRDGDSVRPVLAETRLSGDPQAPGAAK